jgi:hypothetical protein
MSEMCVDEITPSAYSPKLGGYFMTAEQHDAAVGRLVLEKQDLEQKLAILYAEAGRLGSLLRDLGERLRTHPEQVLFENQGSSMPLRRDAPLFKARDIDGEQLIKLITDIRETVDKLADVKRKGAPFGIQ